MMMDDGADEMMCDGADAVDEMGCRSSSRVPDVREWVELVECMVSEGWNRI